MAKKKIKDLIEEISSDFLAENGLELYSTEFVKEGSDWFLRVFIDKAEAADDGNAEVSDAAETAEADAEGFDAAYVSTQDCELVSRFLSDKLDELDPIEQNYYLEVSSPGMDRELTTQHHFDRYAGQLVDVKLYKPVSGSKQYQGVLVGLTDGNVIIKDEKGNEIVFPLDQVAKVNLSVVF